MSKLAIIIIALVLVLVGGFFVLRGTNQDRGADVDSAIGKNQPIQASDSNANAKENGTTPDLGDQQNENVVEITKSGFNPGELTIKAGETVTFINKSAFPSWPASAVHPTHTAYPGSGIQKCGTNEEKDIFDACGVLNTNGSYSFTFNEVGRWRYHDHLNPDLRGTIIVQ